jgi:hypothetical protein
MKHGRSETARANAASENELDPGRQREQVGERAMQQHARLNDNDASIGAHQEGRQLAKFVAQLALLLLLLDSELAAPHATGARRAARARRRRGRRTRNHQNRHRDDVSNALSRTRRGDKRCGFASYGVLVLFGEMNVAMRIAISLFVDINIDVEEGFVIIDDVVDVVDVVVDANFKVDVITTVFDVNFSSFSSSAGR